jgi:hypothetical protein
MVGSYIKLSLSRLWNSGSGTHMRPWSLSFLPCTLDLGGKSTSAHAQDICLQKDLYFVHTSVGEPTMNLGHPHPGSRKFAWEAKVNGVLELGVSYPAKV